MENIDLDNMSIEELNSLCEEINKALDKARRTRNCVAISDFLVAINKFMEQIDSGILYRTMYFDIEGDRDYECEDVLLVLKDFLNNILDILQTK